MKTCKHCKADVPDNAKRCQHCSGDLRSWFRRHWIISGILGLFLFVSVVSGISSDGKGAKSSNSTTASSQESVKTEDMNIKITASQLYAEYEANEISADEKYKGKTLEVSGIVDGIAKDILNSSYVILKTSNIIGRIQCYIEDSEQSKAAALQKGQKITVIGRNDGKMMNILLKDCYIR